jgi:hypothetical protein
MCTIKCILCGPWLWRSTLCVFCISHDSQGVHYVYFVWVMALKVYIMCILYGPWHSRCTLCVFCMGHGTEGVHYVYFVSAMTLKVYIMCILYESWHSRCTLCVFVWAMILKGYIMCILYGPWHSRCTLCVFCMDHDTEGAYFVEYTWRVWKIPYYLIKQLLTFNFSLLMTIRTIFFIKHFF